MLLYSYCNGFKNNNFWGFILTMWYVNFLRIDLNRSNLEGFILTMWYVNEFVILELIDHQIGFILTMWYVNCVIKKVV